MFRFNNKILLIMYLTLPILLTAQHTADSTNITVMTFNVQMTSEYVDLNKREMVSDLIKFREVDIAGLQEYSFSELNNLAEILPDYSWIGAGTYDGETSGEFSSILYLTEKYELLEHSKFWLSENPDIPGSKSWLTEHVRMVLWSKFRDKLNDREFFVFNTHFDNGSSWARERSSALLLEKIEEIARREAVIITGDFNFEETSEAYKILVEGKLPSVKLFDTRYISAAPSFGPSGTFNGYTNPAPENAIDYIFVNPFSKVLIHGVINDKPNEIFISDHYPVVAELILYYPQMPLMPVLKAVPGDGEVILSWDNEADTKSSDILAGNINDFEGYKLYRSTDINMSDAVIIEDGWDIPLYRNPIFQCDLIDGIKGFTNYGFENGVGYYLGDDSGLKHFYKDTTVQNGRTYYYVLTAYDYGMPETGFDLPPHENSFFVKRDALGILERISSNMQIVIPASRAAGYSPPNTSLSAQNQTQGTGWIFPELVDMQAAKTNNEYKVKFHVEAVDHLRPEAVRHPSDMIYACNGFSVYISSLADSLVYQEGPEYYSGNNLLAKKYTQLKDYFHLNDKGVTTDIFDGIQLKIHAPYILAEFDSAGSGWVTGDSPISVLLSQDESKFFSWQYDIVFTENDSAYTSRTTRYSKIRSAGDLLLNPLNLILGQSFNFYVLNKSFPDSTGTFEKLDLLAYDVNRDKIFDLTDDKVLAGHAVQAGSQVYWGGTVFEIDFKNAAEQGRMPKANDVYRLDFYRPFMETDSLMFSVGPPNGLDRADVKNVMDNIKVVPNPYLAANSMETGITGSQLRQNRRIMFIHIPAQCTIKIFTISGILVKEIKVDNSVENRQTGWDLNSDAAGAAFWDLKTKEGLEAATGYYLYHVKSAKTGHEKLGKFAIIK